MMRMSLLLLVALLWSHSSIAEEKSTAVDPAAFVAAYGPALRTLEERYGNFTCRASHKRPSYDAVVDYAVAGSSFLSVQRYDPDIERRPSAYPQVHVRCESENHSFELSRMSDADRFFISGFGPLNSEILKRYHRRYNKPIALAATHIFDVPMRTLTNSKDAKICRVWSPADESQDTVTVDFRLDPAVFRFHRALVCLRPSRDYQVVSYQLFYSSDPSDDSKVAVYSAAVDYRTHPKSGFDVPWKVLIQVKDGLQPIIVVEAAVVEDYQFTGVPEARFLLTDFGIQNSAVTDSDLAIKRGIKATRVKLEAAAGQEVDVLIPVPAETAAYRVIGAESALVCSRVGCGQLRNLPLTVPPSGSSHVKYRFKAQNAGTETIKITLITDRARGRPIPIELSVIVAERGSQSEHPVDGPR